MHKLFSRTFAALALSLLATIGQTGAAKAPSAPITFSQTRVVFNEGAKSASIDVTNKSETPYMLATSVRLVSVDRQTTRNDRAFSAVPPVRLLMPGETLTVRIVKTGLASREGAGDDVSRAEDGNAVVESARLIRFKMVPAQEKNAYQKPVVRAVITTTLKLFYRPTMLVNDTGVREAAEALDAYCIVDDDGLAHLLVANPSGYWLTFGRFEWDGIAVPNDVRRQMVSPHEERLYEASEGCPKRVSFSLIDEYGFATETRTLNIARRADAVHAQRKDALGRGRKD